MWCQTCGYQAHEGCCEGCIGHTTDGQCVTAELLAQANDELDPPEGKNPDGSSCQGTPDGLSRL